MLERGACFLCVGGALPLGAGDAPAGAPKGFPLALWKPSDAPCRGLFVRCGAQPLVWGCACGRTKGLSARPLETFGCPLQGAFCALRRTAAVGRGMRLRAHQRAFRSPFGNLRVPLAGGFLCVAAHSRWGQGMRLRARQSAFRSPFGNLRIPLAGGFCALRRTAAYVGMRLRAHQRAFRSPFGNLRMSPSMAAGTVRGVALDVQESRPALRRRPTSLSACERPLAPPALLYSGDSGEFATLVVLGFICDGYHNGNGCFAISWKWLR